MSKLICKSKYPMCPKDAQPGGIHQLRIGDLSPTQFAVGKAEVDIKSMRMRHKHKHNPQKLHDYLVVRPVPVVVRKNKFYLVDHHHLVRALYEALHDELGNQICVLVEVVWNASAVENDVYFWKTMYERNWVYLYERDGGGPQPPKRLPKKIEDMQYDAYRSLAWIVRSKQGYIKNTVPFSEFKWADFFRKRVLEDKDVLAGKSSFDDFAFSVDEEGRLHLTADGEEVVEEAMSLVRSSEARGLPGFIGRTF
ncbi:MAG: ParB-like protein [Thiogranum sp.]